MIRNANMVVKIQTGDFWKKQAYEKLLKSRKFFKKFRLIVDKL